jgi:MYXO-CTERM domain-containing protein
VPDPDIFYCRAEILRDRDRGRAIADLRRYMAPTGVNVLANPEKERRVGDLIALLEACQKDGRPSCEGPWEHPRFRHHTESEEVGESTRLPPAGWAAFALALVVAGLVFWRRRRAS